MHVHVHVHVSCACACAWESREAHTSCIHSAKRRQNICPRRRSRSRHAVWRMARRRSSSAALNARASSAVATSSLGSSGGVPRERPPRLRSGTRDVSRRRIARASGEPWPLPSASKSTTLASAIDTSEPSKMMFGAALPSRGGDAGGDDSSAAASGTPSASASASPPAASPAAAVGVGAAVGSSRAASARSTRACNCRQSRGGCSANPRCAKVKGSSAQSRVKVIPRNSGTSCPSTSSDCSAVSIALPNWGSRK